MISNSNQENSCLRSKLWILVLVSIMVKSNVLLSTIYQLNLNNIKSSLVVLELFSIMPLLLFISFSFLFHGKSKYYYILALDLFISLLFMADIIYARAFGHLISIHMIMAQGVTEDLTASVLSLIKWTDFLQFIDIPVFLLFILRAEKIDLEIQTKKRILQFVFAFALSMGIIGYQFIFIESNKLRCDPQREALILSPMGSHMFDLYRFIYERNVDLDSEDLAEIDKWFIDNSKYHEPKPSYLSLWGCLKGKNIIVVQFESLENGLINQTYGGHEITPNINRLLANSIYFNNVLEQAKDGNSSDAELMFNTSIYPIGVGSTFLRFGDNKYESLPDILGSEGYTSIAIHGDSAEFWNRNRVFPSLGFHRYISEDKFANIKSGGMGVLDESLFAQSYAEISQLKTPYYCFIITLTSHMPFEMGAELNILDLPDKDVTSNYLQTISYTDKCFGEFFNKLDESGFLENSLLIIYGDHEGIHKYYETDLPDNEKKIPFIVYVPGMQGMVIDQLGGQVDMMPTLAYLLGIDMGKWANGVMGRNLLGNTPGLAILPDGTVKGEVDDESHVANAQNIADMIIKGNYFNIQQNSQTN